MSASARSSRTRILSRIGARARRQVPPAQRSALGRFVAGFFERVADEDLAELGEDALVGSVLSAWGLARQRKPGQAQVRVWNPTIAEDGFRLNHTLVEINNDDMPFLVDSVTAELNRTGITAHLVIHPVMAVERSRSGRLREVHARGRAPESAVAESVLQVYIDQHSGEEALGELASRLRRVLADVRAAVEDWHDMRVRVAEVIAEYDASPPPVPAQELEEAEALMRWLENDHFTFLGYRQYHLVTSGRRTRLDIDEGSGLGLLRRDEVTVYEGLLDRAGLPPQLAEWIRKPALLEVGKANRRSTVSRSMHLDTIALRRFDARGRVIGGRVFVGLFASKVFNSATREIPVLRRKVAEIVRRAGFQPKSHDGRALLHILETLPREELFQTDVDRLLATALGVLRLHERQRVALFAHHDAFGRFVSCLVYVPRDRYDTRLRKRMQEVLAAGYDGTVTAFYLSVSGDPLARVHFIVKTTPGRPAAVGDEEIERRLCLAARDWKDELGACLVREHGEEGGLVRLRHYGEAWPTAYRERFEPAEAVADIERAERCRLGDGPVLHLYRGDEAGSEELRLKLFRRDRPAPLSDVLPVLENMGLRVIEEIPYRLVPDGNGSRIWLHDFGLHLPGASRVSLEAARDAFEETLLGISAGTIENDGANALVLAAGLTPRRIMVLRAYCRFLLQAGIGMSQVYIEQTLARHGAIARRLVELFEARMDPAAADEGAARRAERLLARIHRELEDVHSADEDRILRRFANAILATLRTNYFRTDADGAPRAWLSLKFDSAALEDLPLPRPAIEVFVHSARVDAVHLRGGKVARGGIRWSDRREDFRTEVLGLMKSQMTKNAVIVPVGAKGGFIVKRPPAVGDRDALQREGIECYRTMMRGLLDITDNLVDGQVVHPAGVVCHDGEDPYLVVAADKGTATFSDIANAVAAEYGFWLGDAFASGGSAGYDHKAMGITARGAWESIKRHFREMGTDAMTSDFTCVGVGDMSGDVFGNGALYSHHMRLLGAFNHLHIFVDPDPDAAASYAERQRLFELPRSSWSDYDRKLISRGGGVWERSAKAIKVSRQMRQVFGLGAKAMVTPNELIRAMLGADVDLLFFGGIGTYVRSSDESDAQVGDRTNDAVRICGGRLRARVVGEGANLGLTQRGRIEYALAGGRINTDFIDNSAGVDCSDHEVNIKILLGQAVAGGTLTRIARDRLLARMTDEVAALVLRDNHRQSMALSEAERHSVSLLDDHVRFLAALERQGRLNRAVEFLPEPDELDERRADGRGLVRPELAVLLAYAKIVLQEEVAASALVDDPALLAGLPTYFPKPMARRFADSIANHPLRRELLATYVANTIINRTGPGFIVAVAERTGAPPAEIARAYLVCRRVFRLSELWDAVDAREDELTWDVQAALRLQILDLIKRGTWWFLRNAPAGEPIAATVACYAEAVADLERNLDNLLSPDRRRVREDVAAGFVRAGAPAPLARRIAGLEMLTPACDIVRIAGAASLPAQTVAQAYYGLGGRLGIDWLRDSGARLAEGDRWHKAAALGLVDDLYCVQTNLTSRAIADLGRDAADERAMQVWVQARGYTVDRLLAVVAELRAAPAVDLSMLSVAAADLRAMTSA